MKKKMASGKVERLRTQSKNQKLQSRAVDAKTKKFTGGTVEKLPLSTKKSMTENQRWGRKLTDEGVR